MTNSLNFHVDQLISPSCFGVYDGSIFMSFGGGTGPFTYQWSSGDTTQDLQFITSGTYQLTVHDANGCVYVSPEVKLDAPSVVQVIPSIVRDPSCYGFEDGEIQTQISGGTGPYEIIWSDGSNDADRDSLVAGIYKATISDINQCSDTTGTIELIEPDSLYARITAIDQVSCFGFSDGNIQIRIEGGQAPYGVVWNGNFPYFTEDLFSVPAGYYDLDVIDQNLCRFELDSILLPQPDQVGTSLDSLSDVTCGSLNDGYIRLNTFGGSSPYRYQWSNGQLDQNYIDQLAPGTYQVTVLDQLNCKGISDALEIQQLNTLIETNIETLEEILCHGDTSGVLISHIDVSGSGPFTYHWNNGVQHIQTHATDTLYHVASGSYQLTVTDNNGCTGKSDPYYLGQPERLSLIGIERWDPVCAYVDSGRIKLHVDGGTLPYEYYWSTGQSTNPLEGLAAGNYAVTINDKNHCELTKSNILIFDADPILVETMSWPASQGMNNGKAEVLPSGSYPPFDILWDEQSGSQTGMTATMLAAGTYGVTITDAQECSIDTSVIVETSVSQKELTQSGFTLYPNPASDHIILALENQQPAIIQFRLIYSDGRIAQYGTAQCLQGICRIQLNSLPDGLYFLHLIHDSGDTDLSRFIIQNSRK